MTILGMFGLPGGAEWLVILLVALLLFGRRLPEVARGLGTSIVEFKKGLNTATTEANAVRRQIDDAARIESKPSYTEGSESRQSAAVRVSDSESD